MDWIDVNDAVNQFISERLTPEQMREKVTSESFLEEILAGVDERYHAMSVALRIHTLEEMEQVMHNGGPAMFKREIDELEDLRNLYDEKGWVVTIV